MEVFSCMLLHAQREGMIRGIRANQNGPRINHLFFCRRCFLFVRNKVNDVETVNYILRAFEGASGQKINLLKSMLYFIPNTPSNQRSYLSNILGMRMVDSSDNYLGLPLLIGKNKTNVFKNIIDKFSNKIRSWSKRLLSFGGKEIFVKAILQSLPMHFFSIFLILRGILDKLEAKIRSFWYESKQ